MKKVALVAAAAVTAFVSGQAVAAGHAFSREQIQIVGSSTVFPFSATVAERFGKTTQFSAPVVESTGSGGGAKLFCAGTGEATPDITNASRRMKLKEFELCQKNGVEGISEFVIGFDGIVVANELGGPDYALTREDLYAALAREIDGKPNSNMMWSDIRPDLPAVKIEVLGPPPTSGTRDAFVELVMEEVGEHGEIREDGVYVEAGENDALIVSKLRANPNALGIFGFSFLDQNSDVIKGATIDGVEPDFDLIADGDYPVSRSLFFYVKHDHLDKMPGIKEFVAEFVSDAASSEDGYLVDRGLIPQTDEGRAVLKATAENFPALKASDWN